VRLPVDKVYRAFCELDSLSDEQCEAYVRGAERAHRGSRSRMLIVCTLLAVGGALAMIWPAQWLGAALTRPDDHLAGGFLRAVLTAVLAAAVPLLVAVFWRDRWLRRAIARQIKRDRCPACNYSLAGLAPKESRLRCPECGKNWLAGAGGLESG